MADGDSSGFEDVDSDEQDAETEEVVVAKKGDKKAKKTSGKKNKK